MLTKKQEEAYLSKELSTFQFIDKCIKLKILRNNVKYNFALSFSIKDRFNDNIMRELQRADNCLFYSLDSYFKDGFKGKSLDQIVKE